MKILVAEDEPIMLKTIALRLKKDGHDVITTDNGREALHLIDEQAPDLIITDIAMPHMDGFQFIEALKSDKSLPDIPVVFLTSMEDGDHRGKELGAVGYITKPVRADRLLSMVAQHVPGGAHPIG